MWFMVRHPCAESERGWGEGCISDNKEEKMRTDDAKYTFIITHQSRFKHRILQPLRVLCQNMAPFCTEKGFARKSVVTRAYHP